MYIPQKHGPQKRMMSSLVKNTTTKAVLWYVPSLNVLHAEGIQSEKGVSSKWMSVK